MPQRYEREIEEIVKKKGGRLGQRPALRWSPGALRRLFRQVSPRVAAPFRWVMWVAVAGVGVLVWGRVTKSGLLVIVAVGLLLAAYLLSIMRGRESFRQATGYERTWRGRAVGAPSKLHPSVEGLRGRLRRWLGRRG